MSTTQTEFRVEWKDRQKQGPELRTVLSTPRKALIATTAGLAGGIGMAVPMVIYGWVTTTHTPLELPMAATAWLFGLDHFAQNGYHWWPIMAGIGVLAVYGLASGAVFGAVADRFLRLRTLPESIGAGFSWALVSWLFFWYTLLPIARDGAPFRVTATSSAFVGPTWIFIVGFAALGLVTSLTYWLLHGERQHR